MARLSPPKSAIGGRIGQSHSTRSRSEFRYSRTARSRDELQETVTHLENKGFEVLERPNAQAPDWTDVYYRPRTDRKLATPKYAAPVRLGPDIRHKGELNKIAERDYGRTYFELNDEQRHRILRQEKARGKTERQLLGSMQVQIVFRKNQPDHVKSKAETDRVFITEKLYRS